MRRVLMLPFLLFAFKAGAVDMGVIEVSVSYTATLIFSFEIETVIFGNNPIVSETTLPSGEKIPVFKYYEMYKSRNNVTLHSRVDSSPETSITVILAGGKVYSGLLRFGQRKDKLEYDFTEKQEDSDSKDSAHEKIVGDNLMKDRLQNLIGGNDKYLSVGAITAQISFMVGNMRNDNNYTYLKVNVINSTASEYIIEGIIFKHAEKKKGKLNKKEVQNEVILMSVHTVLPQRMAIPGYSSQTMGFVLPIFTTGERGSLLIQFVEKNGSRNGTIRISARDMAKIDVF